MRAHLAPCADAAGCIGVGLGAVRLKHDVQHPVVRETRQLHVGANLERLRGHAPANVLHQRVLDLVVDGEFEDDDDDEEEEEESDEDEEDAAYNWLVLVAKGTVAMLLAQVDAIPLLTEPGSAQLAADLSHWIKVLGAGEMEPGVVLLQVRGIRVYRLAQIACAA